MFLRASIAACLAATTFAATAAAAAPLPRLEKRGQATQLIVDGQPYLVLGGETANTISSDLAAMDAVWPRLVRLNLNTVLVAVAWDWVEPKEGAFDFALVDGLIAGARRHNLRLVFLWFGSWKNGLSSFVPAWVKGDRSRFPFVRNRDGRPLEILSTFSEASRDADTRAYVAFLRHLAKVDSETRTVVMIQMQNEVGVLGDSRDRSPEADRAFAAAVPAPLLDHLRSHDGTLSPELRRAWSAAGGKTSGTWSQVFGSGPAADEIFMAWHYARYMEHMTKAGKEAYPLPVFTNTWIVQPEDEGPGDYPSGGPEPLTLDVWKAGAPSIDFNAPDIYLPNFADWVGWFHRPDNPLFVPESRGDAAGAANAFYAIGQHAAIGYSPFGIDNTRRLVALRPDATTGAPTELEALPLAKAYAVLGQLAPVLLEHQAKNATVAVLLDGTRQRRSVSLGDYVLHFDLRRNRRNPAELPALGYALAIATGPDDYVIAGQDVQVTFTPGGTGADLAGLARVEAGRYTGGRWQASRILSGDDVLLNYKLSEAAADRQSGSGLRFGADGPTVQRVTLYRYR